MLIEKESNWIVLFGVMRPKILYLVLMAKIYIRRKIGEDMRPYYTTPTGKDPVSVMIYG